MDKTERNLILIFCLVILVDELVNIDPVIIVGNVANKIIESVIESKHKERCER